VALTIVIPFDRSMVPAFGSIQYIRERSWGSLIGRINYVNRLSSGISVSDGIQLEAESYFFTGKTNYSYLGRIQFRSCFSQVATSVFVLSKFQKGWEADLVFDTSRQKTQKLKQSF
jgi:hypothetical protein